MSNFCNHGDRCDDPFVDCEHWQAHPDNHKVVIDDCMRKAAEWCTAFRNWTDGDGDPKPADAARDALRDAIHAAITSVRHNA